jgi:hypothetical protein
MQQIHGKTEEESGGGKGKENEEGKCLNKFIYFAICACPRWLKVG